jgi:thiaminase/transcriptional activator TenA
MTGFTGNLVGSNRDLWAAMAGHPFVLALAQGTLLDSTLQAWVQQDRIFVVEERRVVAVLRAHGLPSRLDDLLADLDRSLVLEADAFTRTAADHGVAADAEPWLLCLGYTSYLRCAAYDGALEGLTALYAAERAYLDTWTTVAKLSPADSPYHPWIRNWSGEPFRAFVTALGHDLDELAGTPSPALAGRLGMLFTGAARFELAFWEMCWSGQAWPG